MTNQTTTYGGISLTTILFVVFLILKLTHVIDWSWWWVTSPLWILAALGLSVIAMFAIVTGIITLIDGD